MKAKKYKSFKTLKESLKKTYTSHGNVSLSEKDGWAIFTFVCDCSYVEQISNRFDKVESSYIGNDDIRIIIYMPFSRFEKWC